MRRPLWRCSGCGIQTTNMGAIMQGGSDRKHLRPIPCPDAAEYARRYGPGVSCLVAHYETCGVWTVVPPAAPDDLHPARVGVILLKHD